MAYNLNTTKKEEKIHRFNGMHVVTTDSHTVVYGSAIAHHLGFSSMNKLGGSIGINVGIHTSVNVGSKAELKLLKHSLTYDKTSIKYLVSNIASKISSLYGQKIEVVEDDLSSSERKLTNIGQDVSTCESRISSVDLSISKTGVEKDHAECSVKSNDVLIEESKTSMSVSEILSATSETYITDSTLSMQDSDLFFIG